MRHSANYVCPLWKDIISLTWRGARFKAANKDLSGPSRRSSSVVWATFLGQTGENLEDEGIPCVRAGVRERGGTYDNFSSYHQMLAVIYFPYALFLCLCLTFARIISHVLQNSLQKSFYEGGITAVLVCFIYIYNYYIVLLHIYWECNISVTVLYVAFMFLRAAPKNPSIREMRWIHHRYRDLQLCFILRWERK